MGLERLAFCLRKRAERETDVYFPSLSSRTIAYKGMLTTDQLDHVFPDLVDERVESSVAVVHSRFSTNTFPSWPLSHPFRFIAHNGEINTVMGNRNWMRAREALLASDLIPGDLDRLFPICTPGASDSASFDEVLELLHMGGRTLPHSVLMMIPEAWENHAEMDAKRRAFYEFHSALMEPWDGPACVVFTDGTQVGAVLDRNGLRPSRYWVTDDGLVVLASEVGVLDIDPGEGRPQGPAAAGPDVPRRHRGAPDHRGRGDQGRARRRAPLRRVAARRPDQARRRRRPRARHPLATPRSPAASRSSATPRRSCASCSPRWPTPRPSRSARWAPTPRSRCSATGPRLLFDYFAQLFAQVTNPPLDAIREELVTSLNGTIGPEANLLDPTPGVVPPGGAAVPGDHQRRAGQDPAHQPRRRHAGLHHPRLPRPVRRRRRRRGPRRAPRRDLRRGQRGDRRRRPRDRALRPALRRHQARRSRRC